MIVTVGSLAASLVRGAQVGYARSRFHFRCGNHVGSVVFLASS